MSSDRYTEVTTQGWFSRIGNSLKGIVAGLLLFVLGFPLLFWNEGREVKTHKGLNEGLSSVVSVPSDKIFDENHGKLIHTQGDAKGEELSDPVFGVQATGLKLVRHVKMYQWQERTHKNSQKNLGGSETTKTTYTYDKVWSDSFINSTRFKNSAGHLNPPMPFKGLNYRAQNAKLGAFSLSPSHLDKLSGGQKLTLIHKPVIKSDHPSHLSNGELYFGLDPSNPQIGDFQVTFSLINPAQLSAVALQNERGLAPYTTSTGTTIEFLKAGNHSANAMFDEAIKNNAMFSWLLRAAGFLLMLVGLNMILAPLVVIGDLVPFIGRVVGMGTFTLSLSLAAIFSSLTIAVSWLFYRPLLSLALFSVAVAAAMWITKKRKPTNSESPASAHKQAA